MNEPVAYINVEERKLEWAKPTRWETPTVVNLPFNIPLYIAPPHREWVGLTKNELAEILCDERYQFRTELMLLAAQEKLKEKNNG